MPQVIQLNELIPVVTKLGKGQAILFETGEHDNFWTVVLMNGAVVTFKQPEIRIARSYTHGRGIDDEEMRKIIA